MAGKSLLTLPLPQPPESFPADGSGRRYRHLHFNLTAAHLPPLDTGGLYRLALFLHSDIAHNGHHWLYQRNRF
jgi:hypothetical protein